MKILFLSGRETSYSRNRIILYALRKKHDVRVCTTSFKTYPIRIITTFFMFLLYNLIYEKDLIFIGSIGPTFVPLVRLLSSKKIIFDSYLSTYNTLIEDRKLVKNYFLKKFILYYEKLACMCSNLVLMDTYQHVKYMKWRCKLGGRKFKRLLIGVDDSIFKRRILPKQSGVCNVYFHGTYVPLQGAKYIVRAAKLLKNENVLFHVIGNYKQCERMAGRLGLNNIKFYGRKDFSDIPEILSQADIGLGIFGNTLKTKLVIPNKVYELGALGLPIITSDTPAINEVFSDKYDILLCKPADSFSLAEAILYLKDDIKLQNKLAKNVYRTCHTTFSTKALSLTLNKYIDNLS